MKRRKVKRGRHNFTPSHRFGIWHKPKGFALDFSIPIESWYNPTPLGPLGKDGKDINKLGGISFFSPFSLSTWPKDRRSILVGERPAEQRGVFEIFAYVNHYNGWKEFKILGLYKAGTDQRVTVVSINNAFYFSYSAGTSASFAIAERDWAVTVGPWQGGNKPAPIDRIYETKLTRI